MRSWRFKILFIFLIIPGVSAATSTPPEEWNASRKKLNQKEKFCFSLDSFSQTKECLTIIGKDEFRDLREIKIIRDGQLSPKAGAMGQEIYHSVSKDMQKELKKFEHFYIRYFSIKNGINSRLFQKTPSQNEISGSPRFFLKLRYDAAYAPNMTLLVLGRTVTIINNGNIVVKNARVDRYWDSKTFETFYREDLGYLNGLDAVDKQFTHSFVSEVVPIIINAIRRRTGDEPLTLTVQE